MNPTDSLQGDSLQAKTTVLFHGPNRIGLGHLNRLAAIALALRQAAPEARSLFAVEGGAHIILEALRLPFVPIPSEHLMYTSGHWMDWKRGERAGVGLEVSRAILASVAPAMVVIDCYPSVSFGLAILEKQIPVVLCLRAMKDLASHLSRLRQFLPAVEVILLPHEPGEVTLPEELRRKACFTGTIVRPGLVKAAAQRRRPRRIVINGGGGGYPDTVEFYNFAIQAVSELRAEWGGFECRLIAGPLFEDWLSLKTTGDISIVPYDPDAVSTFAEADLIICQAGYNTVAELEYLGTKAVLVPAPRELDDQFSRARAAALANPHLRTYAGTNAGELAQMASSLLETEVPENVRKLPNGAEHAAERLTGILQSHSCAIAV